MPIYEYKGVDLKAMISDLRDRGVCVLASGILFLEQHDKVMKHPEPIVRLHNLGNSSVDFTVRPWVEVDDYLDVYWDVTRAVKMRFDEEGISIPFPQRDVHVYEEQLTKRPAE